MFIGNKPNNMILSMFTYSPLFKFSTCWRRVDNNNKIMLYLNTWLGLFIQNYEYETPFKDARCDNKKLQKKEDKDKTVL